MQKQLSSTPSPLETPSVTNKFMQVAKKDYLFNSDPKPSTSKEKDEEVVFKQPKPSTSKTKSNETTFVDDFDDDNISVASSRGNPYSRSEEKKIVDWIIQQRRFSEIKGIAMWKILEHSNAVPGRSGQSLKERFRKHILPNIERYPMDETDLENFRMQRNATKPKKRKA